MDYVELMELASQYSNNIAEGDYFISDNSNEIREVLDNPHLMNAIEENLQIIIPNYDTFITHFNRFLSYNRNILEGRDGNYGLENLELNDENNNENNNGNIINTDRVENNNNYIIENNIENNVQDTRQIVITDEMLENIPQPVLHTITCPISGDIMRDPVVNSVGQTYDKASIETWIARGNTTDPNTRQPITGQLTPNYIIKTLINSYIPALGGKKLRNRKTKKHMKSKKHKKKKSKKTRRSKY